MENKNTTNESETSEEFVYIGRPKPMKTKKFEFHKPTKKFYIWLGIFLVIAAFIAYIVVRLVNVGKVTDSAVLPYEAIENTPDTMVLENEYLRMDFDATTTQFSVLQKNTGHVWYSNPQDLASDTLAQPKEKNNMNSTLLVKYSTENGVENVYDSYTYSIKRDFFNVEKSNNEITVNYTISQMEREYKYPLAIYGEQMDEYLSQLSSADQNVLERRCYQIIDLDNLSATQDESELLRKYPGLKDDYLYLIFNPLNTYLKEQCEEIFEKIGYTDEDYMRDKELYKEVQEKIEPAFSVTVSYKLDGPNLIVDIPFDKIKYRQAYPIVQLSVLPFFGAASLSDNGFMLVPEGGGSLIYFNNGKTKQNGYYSNVYGWDYGTDRKEIITETRAAFPVFGVSWDDGSSFISIVEDGDVYAGVTAEISGKLANYNYVRADYKMVHGEQFEVSSRNTSAQYAYEEKLPQDEKIVQRYCFVDSSSYVDMAKVYRDYLFADSAKLANTESPLTIELVGAVDKVQQVLGFPKTMPYKLTTYEEAADIINQVEDLGIKNVNYKLSGAINGGIRQKMLGSVKFISELGGTSGFKKLLKETDDTSAKIYLDATTQFAYRSGLTDGFFNYRDAARFASSELCKLSEFSPVWYGKLDTMDTYYYLNPKVVNKASDVLIKSASKYNLSGISYRDAGNIVSADYNSNRPVSRQKNKLSQIEKFQEAESSGLGVMINGGNAYALDNVDIITNLDLHGNDYAILDKDVPFYPIALHGYKNFTGSAVNLGYENNQIILESAEVGAGLYYTFMKESEKALQETNYTEYYAACFETWKDRLAETYKRYNKEVGSVRNAEITDHDYLDDDNTVSVTTFDNGTKIYVNFGYVDFVTDEGINISAREYKVLQGGK